MLENHMVMYKEYDDTRERELMDNDEKVVLWAEDTGEWTEALIYFISGSRRSIACEIGRTIDLDACEEMVQYLTTSAAADIVRRYMKSHNLENYFYEYYENYNYAS